MKRSVSLALAGLASVSLAGCDTRRVCDPTNPNDRDCQVSSANKHGSTFFGFFHNGSSVAFPPSMRQSPALSSVARGGFGSTGSAHSGASS